MDKVIVALDFPNFKKTKTFLESVENIHFVKIGMELFYSEGRKVIEYCKSKDLKVFLDLKLHDIPTTVERSLKVISKLDVDIINVHALGGREMLSRAASVFSNSKTKLIGVTILTSHDQKSIHDLNLMGNIQNNVANLVRSTYEAGLSGVVCSGQDLEHLKNYPNFLYVTPGIRLFNNNQDQKRVLTPSMAFKNGATHLVMGREITRSNDPNKVIEAIKKDIRV